MKFLDNLGLNRFREVSFLKRAENKQDNPQKQPDNHNNIFKTPEKDTFEYSSKRLNDLDTNILHKSLFKFLPDDSLRLEIELQLAEDRKKDVETEMKVLSFLGIDENSEKFKVLEEKEKKISKEIQSHRHEYRNLGVMYRVIDSVSDIIQKSKDKALQAQNSFMGSSFVKGIKELCPPLKKNTEIKQTLNTSLLLSSRMNIMFSSTVIPFGEKEQNLRNLAEVMTKAGSLDSKIAKMVNSTKQSGVKIGDFFQKAFNKAISAVGDFTSKLISKIPRKQKIEQKNFFAASSNKSSVDEVKNEVF